MLKVGTTSAPLRAQGKIWNKSGEFGTVTAGKRMGNQPPAGAAGCYWGGSVDCFSIFLELIGGLEHFLFFDILGIIIPTDFHIFQRSRYTTNQHRSNSSKKKIHDPPRGLTS